jgi:SanA protein
MIRRAIGWILMLAALGAAACALLYTYVAYSTKPYIFKSNDALPHTEVALVLGASVSSGGVLSNVLRERADEAVALYNAHKVTKILVTGDNATLSHNEVDPVGKYLVASGIPKADVFLDHAGFDTYSSMYRARDVFGVTSLTVVSQPFHLPRAVYIARSLGLEAYGASAEQGGLFLYNYAREVPATVKATYDIYFERVPKYLGTQYPITGTGEETWGGWAALVASSSIWK